MKKSGITTHVLDTMLGKPGRGIKASLSVEGEQGVFTLVHTTVTDDDGRVQLSEVIKSGVHKIRFDIGEYYTRLNIKHFFPFAEVVFVVDETEQSHYHVPLVTTPFAYQTYRGS